MKMKPFLTLARQLHQFTNARRLAAYCHPSIYAVLVGLLAFASAAQADEFSFNQDGGNWSDPNNWTTTDGPAGVPTAGDDAFFGGVNDTYTVTANGNAIHNIIVDTSDITFNLSGNLTASGALTTMVPGFIRITGSGTLSANSISAAQFTIGSGTTVTTSSFQSQTLTMTGATLNAAAFNGDLVQISAGSSVTSTTATLSSDFGPSTLDASTWKVTGLFTTNNAYTLTIKNGASLTSGSALTAQSGGVTVDGTGSSWKIAGDAQINSQTGTSGGLEVERGGVATLGGNLLISDGVVYANYTGSSGASRIDVSGKVDASALSSVYIGQNGTLTSVGVAARGGSFLDVNGTWTNTGGFVLGDTGQNAANSANQLIVNGTLTNTGDLTLGQGAAYNSFSDGGLVKSVKGVLAQLAGSITNADVSGTWNNSGTLTVADAGVATLTIDEGGFVTDTAATVGNQAGSNGSVSVSTGGNWTVSGNLTVGAAGSSTGSVMVGSGGQLTVTGSTITLGRDKGSVGTLSLDNAFGQDTQFTFGGDIQVGLAGKGTLNILDGFQLDLGAKSLVLGGQAGSSGTLHVSDDIAAYYQSATTTMFKSTDLTVGSLGSGIVNIENQGVLTTSGNAILGEMTGGNGQVTLTGMGAMWEVDGNLTVGKSGSTSNYAVGELAVAAGAELKVGGSTFVLGQEAGSRGTLVVDGTGSKVVGTGASSLEIGRHGIGTLQLQNHAQFFIPSTVLGAQTDGAGQITVTGVPGSDESTQTMLNVNGSLTVGGASGGVAGGLSDPGSQGGVLTVTGGGQLTFGTDGNLIVGRDAGSTGLVNLSGSGSSINNLGTSGVVVGQSGTGVFNVSGGAGFFASSLVLGQNQGSNGTLTVTGSGGTNDSTLSAVEITVGDRGTGTLNLQNDASLTSNLLTITIGNHGSAVGTLSVDGAGTSLQIPTISLAPTAGQGTLNVTNGGQVQLANGISSGEGNGTILVSGASSMLTAKAISLLTPDGGMTILTASTGGTVVVTSGSDSAFTLGGLGSGGLVTATVTGTGSQLTVANGGTTVEGSLTINNGGAATLKTLNIASPDGTAMVAVGGASGSASTLTVTNELALGATGSAATLDIGAGGQVTSQLGNDVLYGQIKVHGTGASFSSPSANTVNLTLSSLDVTTGGSVNIGGTLNALNSPVALSGGGASLSAGSISLGASSNLSLTSGDRVSVASSVTVGSGSTVADAGSFNVGTTVGQAPDGTAYVGLGGKLKVNGEFYGAVTAQLGGSVGGSGTINGKVINGGVVAPGNPQTLTINGDYTQTSQGLLQIVVAGAAANEMDHFNLTGQLTLQGGATLELDFTNGYAPTKGAMYNFLNYGSLDSANAQFGNVMITGLAPGFDYSLVPDPTNPNGIDLLALNDGVATTVPEPGTWVLTMFAGSIAAFAGARQVRRSAG